MKAAREIEKKQATPTSLLEHVSIAAIDRLETLSDMHRARVVALIEREKLLMKDAPWSVISTATSTTNDVMKEYREKVVSGYSKDSVRSGP